MTFLLPLLAGLVLTQTAAPAQKPRPAAPLTLSIEVTDRAGEALDGVGVSVSGPVERSGTTADGGTVVFRGMRPGTYRLRFEHDAFTTLEREIVVRAGQPASVSVALTPVPEAPPAEPAPDPAPAEPVERHDTPARTVPPRAISIPDFLDENLIGGGEPQRSTELACTDGGTARLLQIREPLTRQEHAGSDEILYVVAGSGVVNIEKRDTKVGAGHFVLVPRGVAHHIRREGRNPLILLSVLAGERCP